MSKILFTEDFIVISKSLKEIKKELITYKGDDFECKFIENQHKVYSKNQLVQCK
jgi:hypothetical protein